MFVTLPGYNKTTTKCVDDGIHANKIDVRAHGVEMYAMYEHRELSYS